MFLDKESEVDLLTVHYKVAWKFDLFLVLDPEGTRVFRSAVTHATF